MKKYILLFLWNSYGFEINSYKNKIILTSLLLPFNQGTYQEQQLINQHFQTFKNQSLLNQLDNYYNFQNNSLKFQRNSDEVNMQLKPSIIGPYYTWDFSSGYGSTIEIRAPMEFSFNKFRFDFNDELVFYSRYQTIKTQHFHLNLLNKTITYSNQHFIKFQSIPSHYGDIFMITDQKSVDFPSINDDQDNIYNKIYKILIGINKTHLPIAIINEIFPQWLVSLKTKLIQEYFKKTFTSMDWADCNHLITTFHDKKFAIKGLKNQYQLVSYELTGKTMDQLGGDVLITINNNKYNLNNQQFNDLILLIIEISNEDTMIMDKNRIKKIFPYHLNKNKIFQNMIFKINNCIADKTCESLKQNSWQWCQDVGIYPVESLAENYFFMEKNELFHHLMDYFQWYFSKNQEFFLVTAYDGWNFLNKIMEPLYSNPSVKILLYDEGKISLLHHKNDNSLIYFPPNVYKKTNGIVNNLGLKDNLNEIASGLWTMVPQQNPHQFNLLINLIMEHLIGYINPVMTPCFETSWYKWWLCWWNQEDEIIEKDIKKIFKLNDNNWVFSLKIIIENKDVNGLMDFFHKIINQLNKSLHKNSLLLSQSLKLLIDHWMNPEILFIKDINNFINRKSPIDNQLNQKYFKNNLIDFLRFYDQRPIQVSLNQVLIVQHRGNISLMGNSGKFTCIESSCHWDYLMQPIKLLESYKADYYYDYSSIKEQFLSWDKLIVGFWSANVIYRWLNFIKIMVDIFRKNYLSPSYVLKKIEKSSNSMIFLNCFIFFNLLYRLSNPHFLSDTSYLYGLNLIMAYLIGTHLFINCFFRFELTYFFFLWTELFVIIAFLTQI